MQYLLLSRVTSHFHALRKQDKTNHFPELKMHLLFREALTYIRTVPFSLHYLIILNTSGSKNIFSFSESPFFATAGRRRKLHISINCKASGIEL